MLGYSEFNLLIFLYYKYAYMNFNIPQVTSNILEEILILLQTNGINTDEVGVFKDIAFKIAMIQNSKKPELNKPTHFIVNSNSEEKSKAELIHNFNGSNLLDIEVIRITEGNNMDETPISLDTYNYQLNCGSNHTLEAFKKGSNCISFGLTNTNTEYAASIITSEITNNPIEDCIHYNSSISKQEQESQTEKTLAKKAAHVPFTLIDIMCSYGEKDLICIVGGMLKAAELQMIILIDNFIVSSALLYAYQLNEHIIDYCIFTNQSSHKGHQIIIDYFEKKTILNLEFETNIGLSIPISLPVLQSSITWLTSSINTQQPVI